jgi:uncharacterized membrane protein YbhN (UPF0104 family)
MKKRWPSIQLPGYVKTILKLSISVLILILIFRKIDVGLLFNLFQSVNPLWLVWAAGWFILSKIISASRFRLLLTTETIFLAPVENLKLYWLGMYYNLLLPGGISGDGYKVKVLMDAYQKPLKPLVKLSIIDRVSGLLALVQLSLLLVPFIPQLAAYRLWILPTLTGTFIFLWAGYRFAGKQLSPVWMKTTLYSTFVQIAQTIAAAGLVYAVGQEEHLAGYLLLFLISSLVAMFPVTIGGAGAREITFLFGATFLNVVPEQAVAIGFLFYLISTIVALYGIVFSFKKIIKGNKHESTEA